MNGSLLRELNFHPLVQRWFENRFEAPSEPQRLGWPVITGGENALIFSPTGSGKTLTAFLWSLSRLLNLAQTQPASSFEQNRNGVHTLYISPLKALNNDIAVNLKQPLREISGLSQQLDRPPHHDQVDLAVRSRVQVLIRDKNFYRE